MNNLVSRGRAAFVWRARVKPIGLPIAAGAALVSVRRDRSALRALLVAGTALGLSVLAAQVEFEFRRASWRRAQLLERRRLRESWREQTGV